MTVKPLNSIQLMKAPIQVPLETNLQADFIVITIYPHCSGIIKETQLSILCWNKLFKKKKSHQRE